MHLFEKLLSISAEEISVELRGINEIIWENFILNPRRLRGSDFLMRWSQGVWSERRVIEAVNKTSEFYAIPYGPSSIAPSGDIREYELYFERLEQAGLGTLKRPDLLIFQKGDAAIVDRMISGLGGHEELPFIIEAELSELLDLATIGIECENSLWVTEKMKDFGSMLRPMRRLDGKLGLPKNAVLPTVIIKEEDRNPLKEWQHQNKIPIHVWQVFFDRAFGLALNEAERLINEQIISPTVQIYQAPGGASTQKSIYKFYYHYAYEVGESTERPELEPDYIEDNNGHILPYVRFKGGVLKLSSDALSVLQTIDNERD